MTDIDLVPALVRAKAQGLMAVAQELRVLPLTTEQRRLGEVFSHWADVLDILAIDLYNATRDEDHPEALAAIWLTVKPTVEALAGALTSLGYYLQVQQVPGECSS